MMGWQDCPEAAGPVTESAAGGGAPALDVQALAQHSVRLPRLDQGELAQGRYVPLRGADPYQMPAEMRDRERAEADRRWEIRSRIERAALEAGASSLEAAATYDRIAREASEIADKAVSS